MRINRLCGIHSCVLYISDVYDKLTCVPHAHIFSPLTSMTTPPASAQHPARSRVCCNMTLAVAGCHPPHRFGLAERAPWVGAVAVGKPMVARSRVGQRLLWGGVGGGDTMPAVFTGGVGLRTQRLGGKSKLGRASTSRSP